MFILLCSPHSFLLIELLTTSLILISFFFFLVALSLKSPTRGVSINYCIVLYYFPFPNVDLGITVVSVLQNMRGSTLGREKAHFRGKTVWSINLMIFPENSRETVSVLMICDEYCSLTCGSPGLPVAEGLRNVFLPRGFLVSGFTFSLISPLSSHCHSLPTGNLSPTTVWVLEAEFRCKCETRSSTLSTGNPAKSLSSLSLWLESSIARASS